MNRMTEQLASVAQYLEIWLDGQRVRTVELEPGDWAIGKSQLNRLDLPHPHVAVRHAELRVEAGGASLIDLDSPGGTLLIDRQPPAEPNQRLPPHQPHRLEPGDQFTIGPFRLRYTHTVIAVATPQRPAAPQLAPPSPAASLFEPPSAPLPTVPEPGVQAAISRYLHDLPVVYHDGDGSFLGRYLRIFEHLWEPFERRQDCIDYYFDPLTTPARLLPVLAGWLYVDFDTSWPEGRQRAYLKQAVDLYRRRGTYDGLRLLINALTGLMPDIADEPNHRAVVRVRVRLPADGSVQAEQLAELIRKHKPAHVGFYLELLP